MRRVDGMVQCFDGCGVILKYTDVGEHKYICPNLERIQCPECDVMVCSVSEFIDHLLSRHETFAVEDPIMTWSGDELIALSHKVQQTKNTIFILSDTTVLYTNTLMKFQFFSDHKDASCTIHIYTQEDGEPVESCYVDNTVVGTCASIPQFINSYLSRQEMQAPNTIKLVFNYINV